MIQPGSHRLPSMWSMQLQQRQLVVLRPEGTGPRAPCQPATCSRLSTSRWMMVPTSSH